MATFPTLMTFFGVLLSVLVLPNVFSSTWPLKARAVVSMLVLAPYCILQYFDFESHGPAIAAAIAASLTVIVLAGAICMHWSYRAYGRK